MTLVPSSLRNRLVLAGVAVGLTFAVLFGIGATWSIRHAEDQAVTAALQSRLELARDGVTSTGALRGDAGSPKTDLVQVVAPDGTVRSSSPALAGLAPLIDVSTVAAGGGPVHDTVALQQPDIDLALLGVPIRLDRSQTAPAGTGLLIVAVDAEGFNAAATNLQRVLVAGLLTVVVAIAILSWVLTGHALRSVTRLTESAEAVGPDDLATGLSVPRQDAELARLVGALNRMLVRLHHSHSTELAFAADASHRLRTPVATLRAEAELAVRETDPDQQLAALQRIIQDADQLTLIVDRMLARSRARRHTPQVVVAALGEAGSRWRRQAELAEVNFEIDVGDDVAPTAQCAELVEIIEPVVDNAVRHTPVGGCVRIEVRAQGNPGRASDRIVIDVSNAGDGVAADTAPHVFDAWFSSRDASVAGGLGLWLARETARDIGGDVALTDARADSTTFRIVVPTVDMGPAARGARR